LREADCAGVAGRVNAVSPHAFIVRAWITVVRTGRAGDIVPRAAVSIFVAVFRTVVVPILCFYARVASVLAAAPAQALIGAIAEIAIIAVLIIRVRAAASLHRDGTNGVASNAVYTNIRICAWAEVITLVRHYGPLLFALDHERHGTGRVDALETESGERRTRCNRVLARRHVAVILVSGPQRFSLDTCPIEKRLGKVLPEVPAQG